MKLILRREPQHPDCTLGLLFLGDLSLVTLERPWVPSPTSIGGTKGVSCVPPGTYQLRRHNTDAHPMTWALVNPELGVEHFSNEPNVRTAVLIHPANFVHELRGCIAPGTRTAAAVAGHGGGYMVCDSRKAFRMLQQRMQWTDEHTLEIT